jgi:hypothetical protein
VLLERDVLPNLSTRLKHLARESGFYTIYTNLKCRIYSTLFLHTRIRRDRMIKVIKSAVNNDQYLLNSNGSMENR